MPNEVLLCIPVAEHLQPGESYKEAACRGLKEELGVHVSPSSNRLRLFCPARPHVYTNDTKGIRDFEFQECYLLEYDGELQKDNVEVDALAFKSPKELFQMLDSNPLQFTPWFKQELEFYKRKSVMVKGT